MIIGVGFPCIVKGVKRSIGQLGNHVSMGETNRAEHVQSQNRNNQQKQIPGGGSGSGVKIILKIEKQSVKNEIFKV